MATNDSFRHGYVMGGGGGGGGAGGRGRGAGGGGKEGMVLAWFGVFLSLI